jgi:hypothetical protein
MALLAMVVSETSLIPRSIKTELSDTRIVMFLLAKETAASG